ncbi:MAG: hydro-lyase, Fe-S type, tartrate/fumarate subfamily, beta subunit [Clostridiales bacterium]|jgi:fumarate hydratase subunit beta|nr:hydro-lyase, Fe-S type, tartrate/fumarate subfamily, beta subunit [Clostridiales bacterium]
MITIEAPISKDQVRQLKAGDTLKINGVIYAARDAAHKLMINLINEGKALPFDIKDQIIYYVGPCPASPGKIIGSAGPTTSSRMDAYAPKLIELGLNGMIGKGLRNEKVIAAMKKYGAVYLGATGGAGALIAQSIIKEEVVAFPELGPEAIRRLTVKDFPVTVIIDSDGNNLYDRGREEFKISN